MGLTFTKLGFLGKKEVKIGMAGLDGTGKTAILHKLKLQETVETTPTTGFACETFEFENISYSVVEVGGQTVYKTQQLRKHFFYDSKALIYVVDSNDRDRVVEAKDLLHDLLKEEQLRDASLLVLANKQDLPNAMNAAEITDELGLNSIEQRDWYVQSTCGTSGEGLHEGFEWLSNNIAKN